MSEQLKKEAETKQDSLTIQIPAELKTAIEYEARRLGMSAAALIRQRLAIFLNKDATIVAFKEKKIK
ncbi:MAG: hypothetical protein WCS96_07955 [Victivallales bacterium]